MENKINDVLEDLCTQLLEISDLELQEAMKKMDNLDLVLSLIAAPPEVLAKIIQNLSPKAVSFLKEDIVRARDRAVWGVEDEIKVDNSAEAQQQARTRIFRTLVSTRLSENNN